MLLYFASFIQLFGQISSNRFEIYTLVPEKRNQVLHLELDQKSKVDLIAISLKWVCDKGLKNENFVL
ncbi:MAG TPA: hypothetical protein PKD85_15875, partial [Saprospiraceae bacterium]|nr:hypothetical protein [Saprospiraceae bacterium]